MSMGPIVVFAILFVVGVNACSIPEGWYPPTIHEQMLYQSQIVYGRVERTTEEETGEPWPDNQYVAEVQVYCILKGQRTRPSITILDVGQLYICARDVRE